jgi:hypothetical protein
MVHFRNQTNRDGIGQAVMALAALATMVMLIIAQTPAGFCDEDCSGQCATECDCLSCVPSLPMVVAPVLVLDQVDEPLIGSVPAIQLGCCLTPVRAIDHPPQLSA